MGGGVTLLAALLAVAGAGFTASSQPPQPGSVTAYVVQAAITPAGEVRVTETITYDLDPETGHELVRSISLWDELPDGRRWLHPVTVETVTADGDPVPFDIAESDASVDVKVNAPEPATSGTRDYAITYSVTGALRSLEAADLAAGNPYGFAVGDVEFYWDFIGREWAAPKSNVRVTIAGPGPILAGQCIDVGLGAALTVPGESAEPPAQGCTDRISGSEMTVRAPYVNAQQGLAVAIAFPGESFTTSFAPVIEEPSLGRFLVPGVLVITLTVLLVAAVIVLRRRRRMTPSSVVADGPGSR
jgi:hypothetical protein